jgi:hypothetical protein
MSIPAIRLWPSYNSEELTCQIDREEKALIDLYSSPFFFNLLNAPDPKDWEKGDVKIFFHHPQEQSGALPQGELPTAEASSRNKHADAVRI